MSTFGDLENAFEKKFALDEDQKFRARMRRNHLLAAWAASLLDRKDVDAYAQDLVSCDIEDAGDDDILRKLMADFEAMGLAIAVEEVRTRMVEFAALAATQIQQD